MTESLDSYAKVFMRSTDAIESLVLNSIHSSMGSVIWEMGPVSVRSSRHKSGHVEIMLPRSNVDHEEWLFIDLIRRLTCEFDVVVNLSQPSTILSETAELLPTWCNVDSQIYDRLFFYRGSMCIIVPSELHEVKTTADGAEFLLKSPDPRLYVNKMISCRIMERLRREEWLSYPMHEARVLIPPGFAAFLQMHPQLVSLLISYLPADPDINKFVLRGGLECFPFAHHSIQHECVPAALQFTRLQWASLRSLSVADVLPVFRRMSGLDLIGKLLLSAFSCLVKRGSLDVLNSACIGLSEYFSAGIDVAKMLCKAAQASERTQPIRYLHVEPDESWLEQHQEYRDSIDRIDFADELEKFMGADCFDGEVMDSCSSSSGFSELIECGYDENEFLSELTSLMSDIPGRSLDPSVKELVASVTPESATDPAGPFISLLAGLKARRDGNLS